MAAFCVILFHSAGWVMTSMFSWSNRYPISIPIEALASSPSFYFLRAVEQVVVFSIPAFIFVSGYFAAFLAGRHTSKFNFKQTFTRIRGLLIPYLIWSIFFLGLGLVEGKSFSPGRILTNLLIGSTTPAYYYVPLIIQLYLIAPLLIFAARKNWKVLLIVTGLIQVFIHLPVTLSLWGFQGELIQSLPQIPKWIFITRVFWFSAGIVAGLHLSKFKPSLQRMNTVFGLASIFFLIAGFIEWEVFKGPLQSRETIIDGFYQIAILLFFLSLGDQIKLPFNKTFNFLSAKSFGIYLAHVPVMEIFARGIYLFTPWILPNHLLFFALIFIAGLGIPLLGMQIIFSTKLRPIYGYLFG
ncbi:acyltransferase family protein [Bellilinea caldifistulae]|uniref:acyltransferase family protein n=1 Tax=Bellilinea caldifistulae TaxID=360411 RepID=UPI0023516D42|nr:acyltransferase [Bellilinea caldifistulae]